MLRSTAKALSAALLLYCSTALPRRESCSAVAVAVADCGCRDSAPNAGSYDPKMIRALPVSPSRKLPSWSPTGQTG